MNPPTRLGGLFILRRFLLLIYLKKLAFLSLSFFSQLTPQIHSVQIDQKPASLMHHEHASEKGFPYFSGDDRLADKQLFSIKDLGEYSPHPELPVLTVKERKESDQPQDSFLLSSPTRSGGESLSSFGTPLNVTDDNEESSSTWDEHRTFHFPHKSPEADPSFWQRRSEFLEGKIELLKQTFTHNLKSFLTNHEKLSRRQQNLLEKLHAELQISLGDQDKFKKQIAKVRLARENISYPYLE
jgi:hypothetical protein